MKTLSRIVSQLLNRLIIIVSLHYLKKVVNKNLSVSFLGRKVPTVSGKRCCFLSLIRLSTTEPKLLFIVGASLAYLSTLKEQQDRNVFCHWDVVLYTAEVWSRCSHLTKSFLRQPLVILSTWKQLLSKFFSQKIQII